MPIIEGSLHFSLLGPLEVTYDGRQVDLGRPKQRAVLAALLIHANRVVSLDRFAELLWPEEAAARSTGSLPVYIANLRRLMEPERPARTPPQRLLTRPPGYLLRVEAPEYDAATFEALAAAGNCHLAQGHPGAAQRALGEALALWRGRPLEEFAFAEMEAARLEDLRVAAMEDRIAADLALGAHTAVVAELQILVREYHLRERLVGLLMVALYRSGRQTEALRAYTAARDYLRGELGIEPGPELRRLEADILAQSPALDWREPPPEGVPAPVHAAPQTPPVPPADRLVGRQTELAALDDALVRLGRSSGTVVLVSGEPGIGKTRLAREAVSRAAARHCVVAWGRCSEGEGAPPFWPWIQVIRALLAQPDVAATRAALAPDAAEVAQLVPEVKDLFGDLVPPPPLDPASARFRFFEAVTGFLERLSRARPVAIVLDDLHWADLPSLQLFAHLGERVHGMDALLVATYRNVDPAPDDRLLPTLARVARLPRRLDLSLDGLSEDEVAQFIAHEAGAEPGAGVVAAVWARAGGNPFFVGELTRLLLAERALTEVAARTAGVPWAVRQVIGRRLARLPEETRRLLTVAAVAGQEFDLRVVATAADVALDRAVDLIDLAVATGVVVEHGEAVECFRFSHALVQETVYEETSGLRRAGLHGRVAEALETVLGAGAAATEVAHHLYEAAPVTGPERAIAAALRASASAQAALAYEVAEDHLRRALVPVGALPAGRARDRLELDVQIQLAALLTLVKGVAVAETATAWSRATELCQEVEDRRLLLPSLWGMLSFAWASGDAKGARLLGEHILQLGSSSSEPVVTAAGHLGLGSVALGCGDLNDGARHLRTGKELVDGMPDDLLADVTYADLRVQLDSWLALALHLQGDHDEGRRVIGGALGRARALGDPFTVAIGIAFAVFSRLLSGEIAEARRLADELLDHSDRHQLVDFAFHAGVVRAWAMSEAAEPRDEVVAVIERLPATGNAGIRPWRPVWLALQAEVWQRIDRPDEARACVDEAFAEVDAMGSSFCVAELHRLRGELLAASAPERRAEALADVAEAVRRADSQGAVVYRARAEASLARLEADTEIRGGTRRRTGPTRISTPATPGRSP